MGLTMRERHAVTRELTDRYRKARKKERGQILDEFTALTGYNRSYARFMLRNCGKRVLKTLGANRVVYTCGLARSRGAKRHRGGSYATVAFLEAIKRLWALSDGLCGKRLAAFLREALPHLERTGDLTPLAAPAVQRQLLVVSPATLDRLLAPTKREARLQGRSYTQTGPLLKHQIPVRTFADWNDARPGFCEADLVAHDGGINFGDFCHTLTLTDVATCWTEPQGVQNKAQRHVFAALQECRLLLPFPLLGLDSDNGSEFINHHLVRYCEHEHITFTRSRAYRKNDNCYVEQKNNSVVRRSVGYYRYDRPEQLDLLAAFYRLYRLYVNFFQPVMKLREKIRTGSHLCRRYDTPRTPYRRVLEHPTVSDQAKEALTQIYDHLHLVALKRELNTLQLQLFESALATPPPTKRWVPPANHPWRECALENVETRRQHQYLVPPVTSTG